MKQGDRLLVHLRVQAERDIRDAVLVDLQPGGVEVENLHLGDFAELANVKIEERPVTDWDYGEVLRRQEYKDDRYLAAIDLQAWHGGNINLFYVVRAVTPGDYIVPPPFVEDMYRPQVRGQGEAGMGRLVVEGGGPWPENPLRRVNRGQESRGRVRFLSDAERERLLTACRDSGNPDLYIAVVLSLATGARRMEVLGLRWPQLDLARNVIALEETKNGERRSLPIGDTVRDLLKARAKVRRIDSDLVFPGRSANRPAQLRHAWLIALKAAAVEDFHWHDLRHSAASYLAMNGASIQEIAAVLGHKTLAMVKRYAHLSEQHTANVVNRMNRAIFGK